MLAVDAIPPSGDLATWVAPGGFLGMLAIMVGYMLRAIATDRTEYRAALTRERERFNAIEVRLDAAISRADSELALRRAAEIEAARLAAEVEGLRVRNAQLTRAVRQRGDDATR